MDDDHIPLSQKKKALKGKGGRSSGRSSDCAEKPAPPEKKKAPPPRSSKAAAHPTTPGRSPTRHTRHSAFEELAVTIEADADAVAEPPPAQPPKARRSERGLLPLRRRSGTRSRRLRPPLALTRDGTPRSLRRQQQGLQG